MATSETLGLYPEIQSLETVQPGLHRVQIPKVTVTGRGDLEIFWFSREAVRIRYSAVQTLVSSSFGVDQGELSREGQSRSKLFLNLK